MYEISFQFNSLHQIFYYYKQCIVEQNYIKNNNLYCISNNVQTKCALNCMLLSSETPFSDDQKCVSMCSSKLYTINYIYNQYINNTQQINKPEPFYSCILNNSIVQEMYYCTNNSNLNQCIPKCNSSQFYSQFYDQCLHQCEYYFYEKVVYNNKYINISTDKYVQLKINHCIQQYEIENFYNCNQTSFQCDLIKINCSSFLMGKKCKQCTTQIYYQVNKLKFCIDQKYVFEKNFYCSQENASIQCSNNCNNNQYINISTNKCINKCNVYQLSNFEEKICIGDNSDCVGFVIKQGENYQCVSNCPGFLKSRQQNECLKSCPLQRFQIIDNFQICINENNYNAVCEHNIQLQHYMCSDSCQKLNSQYNSLELQFNYNNEFLVCKQSKCEHYIVSLKQFEINDKLCIDKCLTFIIQLQNEMLCEDTCGNLKNFYLDQQNNRNCVDKCQIQNIQKNISLKLQKFRIYKRQQIQEFAVNYTQCMDYCDEFIVVINGVKNCQQSCSSSSYITNTSDSNMKYCVSQCQKFFNMQPNNYKECTNSCSQNTKNIYATQNNQCANTCDLKKYTINAQSQRYCLTSQQSQIYVCEPTKVDDDIFIQQCQKTCAEIDIKYISLFDKICSEDFCQYFYYLVKDKKYCVNSCSGIKQFVINNKHCVKACENNEFSMQIMVRNTTEYYCEKYCDFYTTKNIFSNNVKICQHQQCNYSTNQEFPLQCVMECDSKFYKLVKIQAKNQSSLQIKQCQSENCQGSQKQFIINNSQQSNYKQCVENCTQLVLVVQKNIFYCVNICDSNKLFYNKTDNLQYCISQNATKNYYCINQQFMYQNMLNCSTDCADFGHYYIKLEINSSCIVQCPYYYTLDQNKNKQCHDYCQYTSDKECLGDLTQQQINVKCKFYYVVQNQHLTNNNLTYDCQNLCTYYVKIDQFNMQCQIQPCNQFYFNDSSNNQECVDQCQIIHSVQHQTQCVLSCENNMMTIQNIVVKNESIQVKMCQTCEYYFLNSNQQKICSDSCNFTASSKSKQCVANCTSNYYDQLENQKYCVQTCDLKTKFFIFNQQLNMKQCVDNCENHDYKYISYNKQCQQYCNTKYFKIDKLKVNYKIIKYQYCIDDQLVVQQKLVCEQQVSNKLTQCDTLCLNIDTKYNSVLNQICQIDQCIKYYSLDQYDNKICQKFCLKFINQLKCTDYCYDNKFREITMFKNNQFITQKFCDNCSKYQNVSLFGKTQKKCLTDCLFYQNVSSGNGIITMCMTDCQYSFYQLVDGYKRYCVQNCNYSQFIIQMKYHNIDYQCVENCALNQFKFNKLCVNKCQDLRLAQQNNTCVKFCGFLKQKQYDQNKGDLVCKHNPFKIQQYLFVFTICSLLILILLIVFIILIKRLIKYQKKALRYRKINAQSIKPIQKQTFALKQKTQNINQKLKQPQQQQQSNIIIKKKKGGQKRQLIITDLI